MGKSFLSLRLKIVNLISIAGGKNNVFNLGICIYLIHFPGSAYRSSNMYDDVKESDASSDDSLQASNSPNGHYYKRRYLIHLFLGVGFVMYAANV